MVLNEEKKQGDKKEKLTESSHLTVKIATRSNYNIDLRKLRVNKIPGRRNHKAAVNLPTLRNDSSFAVQFSISVSKTRAILLFKIKIKLIEVFELNERMPGMRSAEYQMTIPLKFFIIVHNYANV